MDMLEREQFLDKLGAIRKAVLAGWVPLDTTGIYLVLSSSDVAGSSAGFCVPKHRR